MKTNLFLLSILLYFTTTVTSLGVNYGTLGNNLPPPAQVAEFLRTKTIIDRIKLFDANPDILRAFGDTNISVTVSVVNGDIPGLVNLNNAVNWVKTNIGPYYPRTKIIRVAVGNEILQSGGKDLVYNLLPAMKSIRQALVNSGFGRIQVRVPFSVVLD